MEQTLTLYQYAVCPFCWKVRALLNLKKIPYNIVEVNPMNKKEIAFSKEYKKVPILMHGQQQVNDSSVIMRYIDEHFGDEKFFSDDSEKQGREEQDLEWIDEVFVRALPPLIYSSYSKAVRAFNYITKEGNFNFFQKLAIKYFGAFIMNKVAKKRARELSIDNPVSYLKEKLNEWVVKLNNQPFNGGDQPNGVDCAAYGILRSIEKLEDFNIVQSHTQAYAWYQKMQQRIEKS